MRRFLPVACTLPVSSVEHDSSVWHVKYFSFRICGTLTTDYEKTRRLTEISGSHGGEYEDDSSLGCGFI
jgi:hypothetical protein